MITHTHSIAQSFFDNQTQNKCKNKEKIVKNAN